ncbi:MAG TPA: amidohydrolase family protein [Streptosporangiaceae bacterium]|nr:amidohydrolase family protein [Streptosporangiaceae bacterium]
MELLTPDRVITGVGGEVLEGGAVLVDGSAILAVGPTAELRSRPDAARAAVRDLSGHTLLPGLIDCHVHLGFDASEAPVAHMLAASDHQLLVEMLRNARRLLAAGVTTARELGARGLLDLVVQEAIEEGKAPGPRLVVSNQPITTTGGHCWFMGCERDDHDGLRRAVREHHKAGAQVIKVMATGGFMTAGSAPWHAQFGLDELRVVVDEARRLGKSVAAHAHGLAGIRNSVAAGVDTIEHCSWAAPTGENFDEEVAAAIVDKGIFVCPTANVHALRPRRIHLGGTAVPEELLKRRRARMRRMRQMGVRLVAGTDAGITLVPHGAYAAGLDALAASGMPAAEVIECATSRAAQACGLGDVTGTVEPGKDADLLAVAGDPVADLSVLHHPAMIMTRGRVYDPAAV